MYDVHIVIFFTFYFLKELQTKKCIDIDINIAISTPKMLIIVSNLKNTLSPITTRNSKGVGMADLDGFLLRRTSPEGQSFRSHTVSESWRKDDQSRSSEGHDTDEDYENVRQTVAVVSCCSVHT